MKETKCSQMAQIMKICKDKISKLTGKNIRFSQIDICICNGYFIMHYENDDICINMEITSLDGDFILTNTEITED